MYIEKFKINIPYINQYALYSIKHRNKEVKYRFVITSVRNQRIYLKDCSARKKRGGTEEFKRGISCSPFVQLISYIQSGWYIGQLSAKKRPLWVRFVGLRRSRYDLTAWDHGNPKPSNSMSNLPLYFFVRGEKLGRSRNELIWPLESYTSR